MKFSTKVSIGNYDSKIFYRDKIISLGSCFSDEIGAKLAGYRFQILVNPFGVIYNPASIASSLERLVSGREFTEKDIIEDGGIYKSYFHSSIYAEYSLEALLKKINESLSLASRHFHESGWVMVTLGTRWIYKLKSTGVVVSNCHKIPQSQFQREALNVEEIYSLLSPLIESFPDKKWLFTVSPIRHWKDGAHENQLSKATLLLSVEKLQNSYENVLYFPAYEILMDELRDYRYYGEDMLHPSSLAVDYIWEQFSEALISETEFEVMDMVGKLNIMRSHRPIFPQSDSFKKFEMECSHIEAVVKKMLEEKYL